MNPIRNLPQDHYTNTQDDTLIELLQLLKIHRSKRTIFLNVCIPTFVYQYIIVILPCPNDICKTFLNSYKDK